MKHIAKRSLSLLLALLMIVSLFSGVTVPASAATYTKNWGTRGTAATSLTSAATAFYTSNSTSYAELSAYSGSSEVSSVPSSELYGVLQTLMVNNHSNKTSYDATRDMYQYTDCQGGSGAISSFYSGVEVGPAWDSGATWNREHVWPNSKGLGGADENDIMMLRPTASSENSARGNAAYGESSNYYDPNSVSGGTYNLHGDVARIFLYVYVRWGNVSGNGEYATWGSNGVMESKEVLLKWMAEDPVDTWELARNDVVQEITGTRNVFVDYPELAFLLFGEAVPSTMTTPSGMAGATYDITAVSNDTAMGTVALSGNNINATPAEGYMTSGYEVLSGTATVTQNGNSFVVSASSDCTIQINFAPRAEVSVTYLNNGMELDSQTVYSGDAITLPEYTGTLPVGCAFVGWTDVQVDHETALPTYYKADSSYTVNKNTNIYALFSYVAEGAEGTGIWTLVTDAAQLSAGAQIVIAYNAAEGIAGEIVTTASNPYMAKVECTFSDDKNTIPEIPADAIVLTLGGSAGAWTLSNSNGDLLGTNAVKKMAWNGSTNTWAITITNGSADIASTNAAHGCLEYNTQSPRYTTYTSNQPDPQLYMLDTGAGSTYYTTATCKHENIVDVAAQAVTCTADGYSAGIYCNDCSTYISGHELIKTTGHSYNAVVTPPTVTDDGYTTYTCTACGNSYVGDEVPALGETYTVSFSVPGDAGVIEDMPCNTSGIILPEAAMEGYTFLGWTTEALETTTTEPVFYPVATKYVAMEDTTLYALYKYAVDGTGDTGYLLVTGAEQLAVGSKVIIAASAYDYALSTTQNENNRPQVAITKNADNTINVSDGVALLTLGEGTVTGTYSFYCSANSGYLYNAGTSSANRLRTDETLDADASFAITVNTDGSCTLIAQGDNTRNNLQYYSQTGLFNCYSTTQKPVSLYIETVDGTVYYTTEIAHTHTGVWKAPVEATCQSSGTISYFACACGKYFSDRECTQELTSIVAPQKEHTFSMQSIDEKYLKSAATCVDQAVYYLSCVSCGISSDSDDYVFYGTINAENHVGELVSAGKTEPTCTEAGHTDEVTCMACNNVVVEAEAIPATGHADAAYVEEVASTCKTNGVKAHYHCDDCGGDYLEKTTSAAAQTAEDLKLPLDGENHEGGTEVKNAREPGCTTEGYTGDIYCLGCDQLITSGETISAIGHALEEIAAVEPTYETEGNITHYSCGLCGKLFADPDAQEEITEKDTIVEKLVYPSILELLAAAQTGETVKMLVDEAVTGCVIIPDGINLDLNGHTLAADYAVAFGDANVFDSIGEGLLKVARNRIILSKSNSMVPIWDNESGYLFVASAIVDEGQGMGFVIDENIDTAVLRFVTFFAPADMLENGGIDNGLSVHVRMRWTVMADVDIENGKATQDFVFNDEQMATVVAANGQKAFQLTLNKFSSLKDISVQVVIVSETGTEFSGTKYPIEVE